MVSSDYFRAAGDLIMSLKFFCGVIFFNKYISIFPVSKNKLRIYLLLSNLNA